MGHGGQLHEEESGAARGRKSFRVQLSGYCLRDRERFDVSARCAGSVEFPHFEWDGGGFTGNPERRGANG